MGFQTRGLFLGRCAWVLHLSSVWEKVGSSAEVVLINQQINSYTRNVIRRLVILQKQVPSNRGARQSGETPDPNPKTDVSLDQPTAPPPHQTQRGSRPKLAAPSEPQRPEPLVVFRIQPQSTKAAATPDHFVYKLAARLSVRNGSLKRAFAAPAIYLGR